MSTKMSERRFSSHHGKNITLNMSRGKATWKPGSSHSWVFGEHPLLPGQIVDVCCSGGGSCMFGFTQVDPNDANNGRALISGNVPQFTEVKFRSSKCVFRYQLTAKGNKVLATCDRTQYCETVRKGSRVWVAVCIKFGTVALTILETGQPTLPKTLSATHGLNIEMSPDRLSARLTNPCPAAICVLHDVLHLEETVTVSCQPVITNKREPGRYQVGIYLCNRKPDTDTCSVDTGTLITSRVILNNEECKGIIRIASVSDDSGTVGNVGFIIITASGREHGRRISLTSIDEMWLLFEPYKASVKLVETTQAVGHRNILGFTVREPRNELAENSTDVICAALPTTSSSKGSKRRERFPVCDTASSISSVTVPKQVHFSTAETVPKQVSFSSEETVPKHVYSIDNTCVPDERRNVDHNSAASRKPSNGQIKRSNITGEMSSSNVNQTDILTDRVKALENEIKSIKKAPELNSQPAVNGVMRRSRLTEHTRRNYTELLRSMQPRLLCDYLFESELMSDAERGVVMATRDHREGARYIVDLLCKKDVCETILKRTLLKAEMGHLITLFLGSE